MTTPPHPQQGPARLAASSPGLEEALTLATLPPPRFDVSAVRCETLMVSMRDGVRLATDLYRPPLDKGPVVVIRTPYDRMRDDRGYIGGYFALARRGYFVVAQDVRGTGQSEPDVWDYVMFEPQDGWDCVEWISQQTWFDGFIGSFGASYVGQVQWQMAMHPKMSATAPGVSGLGFGVSTARLHMFMNAYAKTVGKGEKLNISYSELEHLLVEETLATGFFNDPISLPVTPGLDELFPGIADLPVKEAQTRLWAHYCALDCAGRAQFLHKVLGVDQVTLTDVEKLGALFGQHISHDRHTLPHTSPAELAASIQAPPLFRTAWYDWFFHDALATFRMMRDHGRPDVAARTRMIISPHSHNTVGYKEGLGVNPELSYLSNPIESVNLLTRWYEAVRNDTVEDWPVVTYYLMGANVWCTAQDWPPPEARERRLHLTAEGGLAEHAPTAAAEPTTYRYDPMDPPPTLGGCLVSSVIAPGSVDVASAQARPDVIVFTSPELEEDVDVVGPLTMVLHASTSAVDTDFVARLTDVFPDGRAIQLQNGLLRARFRNLPDEASLLEPGAVYEFEIDMWATANRFRAGHRIRIDISSADFPRYDRNTNTGGLSDTPLVATQSIYHDPERPSHLVFSVIGEGPKWKATP